MEAEQDLSVRVAGYEARIAQLEGAVAELGHELITMQDALESRTLIGRATGLLAAGLRRPVDETWQVMLQISSYSNVKLRDVARLLVLAHDGTPAPGEEETASRVARALDRASGPPADA